MSMKAHFLFWSAAFGLFLLFIWGFKAVLFPFILGMAIAYLLNPSVEKLCRLKLPRRLAVLSLLAGFILVISFMFAIIVPIFLREIGDFIEKAPDYIEKLRVMADPYLLRFKEQLGQGQEDNIKEAAKNHIGEAVNFGKSLFGSMITGGQALVDFAMLVVLTPMVAYFMLQEWPNITKWVEDLMPRESAGTIKDLLRQIDRKISGFVRGQLMVATVLGLFYAIALSIAGLNYGILIGLVAGALSVIPMLGSIIGFITALLVAWFQGGDLSFIGIVAGIFIFGQIVEGNILTPKLVGDSVGLHPLWIIFALMAGGGLFGILGMFLAVPVAAIIGVLGGFALLKYKQSPYYKKNDKDSKTTPS